MTNYYSVVQLVPDPVTDERINIAVIVLNEIEPVRIALTKRWPRVKSFWGHEISSLHALISDYLHSGITLDYVYQQSMDITSSIQFSQPRNSERDADELLAWLVNRMLVQRQPSHRSLTKSGVAAETRRSFGAAIKHRMKSNESPLHVETGFEIVGLKRPHITDVSLHNGRAIFATKALSFLGTNRNLLAKEVELCYWTIEDIRGSEDSLGLAVIVAPPDGGPMADEYSEATRMYSQQNVPVIPIDEVHDWADLIVGEFIASH